jgi:hypothetical protein
MPDSFQNIELRPIFNIYLNIGSLLISLKAPKNTTPMTFNVFTNIFIFRILVLGLLMNCYIRFFLGI